MHKKSLGTSLRQLPASGLRKRLIRQRRASSTTLSGKRPLTMISVFSQVLHRPLESVKCVSSENSLQLVGYSQTIFRPDIG